MKFLNYDSFYMSQVLKTYNGGASYVGHFATTQREYDRWLRHLSLSTDRDLSEWAAQRQTVKVVRRLDFSDEGVENYESGKPCRIPIHKTRAGKKIPSRAR